MTNSDKRQGGMHANKPHVDKTTHDDRDNQIRKDGDHEMQKDIPRSTKDGKDGNDVQRSGKTH